MSKMKGRVTKMKGQRTVPAKYVNIKNKVNDIF